MMRQNNIAAKLLALAILLLGSAASAQTTPELATPKDAPLVGWADGEAAYNWVQAWVRSDAGVPNEQDLPDRAVTGLFGVYITLRDQGRVLGRGQALRDDIVNAIDQPGKPIQFPPLLAAATRQALDELKDKQIKRAIELNITDPELVKIAIAEARKRVQLDIQLGHSLTSIVLPINAPEQAVFTTFAPGFHGLRLAGPLAGKADYAWPAIELSRNNSPPRQIFRLMDLQGYDADELPIVARADGPALQRFNVIHMVRPGPAQPMRQLTRGNVILQQQVIDSRTIAGLAERVARHMDQRITTIPNTGEHRVKGTYHPSLERYNPQWADDREAAMLAYALTRHAAIAIQADIDPQNMLARAKRCLRLVDQLAPAAFPDNQPPQHLTAAFLLLTLCNSPDALNPDQLIRRANLAKSLLDLQHPEGGFRVQPDSDKRLSRAAAAVVTTSLASYYQQTQSQTLVQPLWQALKNLMDANQNDPRVIDLLWITNALDLAGQPLASKHPEPDIANQTLKQWRETLAHLVEQLTEQQIRSKPILGPDDVSGGFILEQTTPGAPPEPDWQSAIPTAILAFALRDQHIIPEDQHFGPVLAAGLGARFLGQLIFTPPSAYYLREPEPALGGVRRTLWDNTLYPDCSSLTLLALAELQQTLITLEPNE